jgi:hypothetical protein
MMVATTTITSQDLCHKKQFICNFEWIYVTALLIMNKQGAVVILSYKMSKKGQEHPYRLLS